MNNVIVSGLYPEKILKMQRSRKRQQVVIKDEVAMSINPLKILTSRQQHFFPKEGWATQ